MSRAQVIEATQLSAHEELSYHPLVISNVEGTESYELSKNYQSSLDTRLVTGFDRDLLILFLHGGIALAWGVALFIFQFGVVPIDWTLSQYGQQHTSIVNVLVTAVATLSTTHLKFTIKSTISEYAAMVAHAGFTLKSWCWIQGFAQTNIRPPFAYHRHPILGTLWLLVAAGMAAHSASLVAILQPESFEDHVLFNDTMPCGIDSRDLTLNSTLEPQVDLDQLAFQTGLQLGNYYDQVAGNTTTAAAGRTFVKDNFSYGALGGLINGRQEVPGAAIVAQCGSSVDSPYKYPLPLADLWTSAFPGHELPAINITNGSGAFSLHDMINTPTQASVASKPGFVLDGGRVGMYGLVNATGSGGVLVVDGAGGMVGCIWDVVPQLVHVQIVNWVAVALGSKDAATIPLPAGRGVLSALQGMVVAVQNGAHLAWVPALGRDADMPAMLEILLADALKGVFTAYTGYSQSVGLDTAKTGAGTCWSGNRTDQIHWRFGNKHNVGWLAIILSVVFGMVALFAVSYVWRKPRVKGINVLEVVDAFKLGAYATDVDGDDAQILRIKNGRVVVVNAD